MQSQPVHLLAETVGLSGRYLIFHLSTDVLGPLGSSCFAEAHVVSLRWALRQELTCTDSKLQWRFKLRHLTSSQRACAIACRKVILRVEYNVICGELQDRCHALRTAPCIRDKVGKVCQAPLRKVYGYCFYGNLSSAHVTGGSRHVQIYTPRD